ncbi:MAG: adenylate kinase [Chloroflexi bacterium]|nr:adenylate kinase [Chloroflexota bacterium]
MRGSLNSPLRLVLLGAPGAGKGTQSQLLCARQGIPHVSTGDILREAQHDGTELDKLATQYADKGELLPDDIVARMVEEKLRETGDAKGFALDGFPRTLVQANLLEKMLAALQMCLSAVIYYDCPEDELVRRLSGRLVCENCGRIYHFTDADSAVGVQCGVCGGTLVRREDDSPAAVRTRLKLYRERTRPLVDYYDSRHLLRRVVATGEIEEIYDRTIEALEAPAAA